MFFFCFIVLSGLCWGVSLVVFLVVGYFLVVFVDTLVVFCGGVVFGFSMNSLRLWSSESRPKDQAFKACSKKKLLKKKRFLGKPTEDFLVALVLSFKTASGLKWTRREVLRTTQPLHQVSFARVFQGLRFFFVDSFLFWDVFFQGFSREHYWSDFENLSNPFRFRLGRYTNTTTAPKLATTKCLRRRKTYDHLTSK